jgi:hypothetical protein
VRSAFEPDAGIGSDNLVRRCAQELEGDAQKAIDDAKNVAKDMVDSRATASKKTL